MKTIGFVGVGKIGLPICAHLLEHGVSVLGYRRGAMDEFKKLGGAVARSCLDLSKQCEIVFSCMPNASALEEVMREMIPAARPGQIFVELGSHANSDKQRYVEALGEKGAAFLDGEVSGTPGMVEQRKAYIYIAGDADAASRVEPIIRLFSDLYIFLGPFGAASQVKLINNMLVALNIAAAAQAMAVGLQLGVPSTQLVEAVAKGSGGSTQFAIRAPWMADRRFLPLQGSAGGLMFYLRGFREMALEAGIKTDIVDAAIDIFERAIPIVGERDVAAFIDYFLPDSSKTSAV